MYKNIFIILLLITPFFSVGQNLSGVIVDEKNNPIHLVNISIENESEGVYSDENGLYNLKLKANRSVVVIFSFIGYSTEKIRIPMLKRNQNYNLNIVLSSQNRILQDVIVLDKKSRKDNLIRIKPKHVDVLPGGNLGFEGILKTLPGVSSTNELSSQYSVRGGNFDENLVYVNDIEVYRPFLIKSGKQEGLSFINPDMIENILFSAGGFSAKYGDKMSSVLDIKYKEPNNFSSSAQLSILGASIFSEGLFKIKNKSIGYLIGARYKSNEYLLNSMDLSAEYKPNFSDIQLLLNYNLNSKFKLSLLGNISGNKYTMIPSDRQTEFGSFNEALRLTIYFEGQEINKYETYFSALSGIYNPNPKVELKFTNSFFYSIEEENFDIIGEYWLDQLDNDLGSNEFGSIIYNRGVGKYINHSRNQLNAKIFNFSHKGYFDGDVKLNWGFKLQKEEIEDNISEWSLIDSAFYNLPHPQDSIGGNPNNSQEILMNSLLKTKINLNSYRNSGFMQFEKEISNFTLNSGSRLSYWTYNEELLISPRASISYTPLWINDIIFRISSGIYYQPSFYKELRTLDGELNYNIKAQKSIHYLTGIDYLFYKWGRPFKWVTEVYYKDLSNLIPYKIDNVRIQYLANNNSNGYAKGVDMKINGEFVPGMESWVSLSVMETKEDIIGDFYYNENNEKIEPGYIPRPTDQRVNFSMFFQDYMPGFPNYKMHLNMIYGTGLPFGPPKSEKYEDILRVPSYRRADIGFSVVLKSEEKESKIKWFNNINSLWFGVEVFNLFNINNTISYLWVSDISNRQYAVPNYLTTRQINGKLIVKF